MNTKEKGNQGEDIAVAYLEKNEYKIIERNWMYRKMEIDILCEKNDEIVIVEVKCRFGDNNETFYDSITKIKQRFLVEAANQYVLKNNINKSVRFDVVFVSFIKGRSIVEHIEDAFQPIL